MESLIRRLIEEIKKRPHLYDPSKEDYGDAKKAKKSWKKIGRTLEMTPDAVKLEWKRMKAYYLAGFESRNSRELDPIEKLLNFLAPFLQELNSSSHSICEDEQGFQLPDASPQNRFYVVSDSSYLDASHQNCTPSEKRSQESRDGEDENQETEMEVVDNGSEYDDLELF